MNLYIGKEKATEGMLVTTSKGQKGILKSWNPPHKQSSTGRVYVKFDNESNINEFFPSVIGGEFRKQEDIIYEDIGKLFIDFDYTSKNPIIPEGWELKIDEPENDIEYLEIELSDSDKYKDFKDIKSFICIKRSKMLTKYKFKRKE